MNPLAIISGILVLSGLGTSFITNSTSGTMTNSDSIYGTNAYVSLTSQYPLIDVYGNSVYTFTNSGTYAVIGPDGRGWQSVVTVPRDVVIRFGQYLPGSLAYEMVTNAQVSTNGLNPAASEPMFSTDDFVHSNYVRNSQFWLAKCPEKTAIVIANGAGVTTENYQIGGSAISPVHVVNCTHAPFTTGGSLLFVDDYGSNYIRSVIAYTNLLNNVDGNDINVCLLNSPLPSTVHPFMLMPTNYAVYIPGATNSPQIQEIGCNQAKAMFPTLCSGSWANQYSYIAASGLWVDSVWNYTPVVGDSGHPIMALVGTNLVLLSHWYSPVSGPNYVDYEAQINSAMHFLSTNNSLSTDYQISTINLSAYPQYQ
ncbi:MAG: hypothetical protein ABSE16_01595 [Verrucomicrobiota bacterium]|jgi:hypothetical protein